MIDCADIKFLLDLTFEALEAVSCIYELLLNFLIFLDDTFLNLWPPLFELKHLVFQDTDSLFFSGQTGANVRPS